MIRLSLLCSAMSGTRSDMCEPINVFCLFVQTLIFCQFLAQVNETVITEII